MRPDHLESETQGHILIVDDEEFIRSSFRLYFETMGFTVSTASHGEAALRIVIEEGRTIDVVLLDLVMPGTHGIEVLRRIKEIEPSIEVIIATGCGNMQSAVQALRFGAFDYITKPIVSFEDDLLKVVQEAFRQRQHRESVPVPSRSQPSLPSAAHPESGYAERLEGLLEASDLPSTELRLQAVGTFLVEAFSATAAIALRLGRLGELQSRGAWGHFEVCLRQHGERFTVLQAASIAETLSVANVWHPVCPEAAGVASPAAAGGQPPEAARIPLGSPGPGVQRVPSGGDQVLVVRETNPTGSSRLELPLLTQLALSTALRLDAVGEEVDEPRLLTASEEKDLVQ